MNSISKRFLELARARAAGTAASSLPISPSSIRSSTAPSTLPAAFNPAQTLPAALRSSEPLSAPMSATERLRARGRGEIVAPLMANAAEELTRQELPGGLAGAVRHIASALEPLALPQDAMFAVVGGALDPNTTIGDRLRTMRIGDYMPGGEAPERPADGAEIFKLLGFDDNVSRWAGLGADLLVDPLVFGSWLRVAGKVSKVDELVKLGDRFDTFISPIGMGREVNQVLRRSSTISAWQDARMAGVLNAIRNPDSVVFGIQRFGEKATDALRFMMSSDALTRLKLGDETGRQVFRAQQLVQQSGRRLSGEVVELIRRAKYGPGGDRSKNIVESLLKAAEGQSAAWERHLSLLTDPVERAFAESATYLIAARQAGKREAGLGFLAEVDPADIENVALRELAEMSEDALNRFENFDHIDDLAGRLRAEAREAVEADRQLMRDRLSKMVGERGRRNGWGEAKIVDEQRKAVGVFDNYLRETLSIDALIGYHMSGFPFVSDMLRSRVFELTGNFNESDRIFKRLLGVGLVRGKKGIDELLDESTGLSITDARARASSDPRAQRTQEMMAAAEDVINRMRSVDDMVRSHKAGVKATRQMEDAIYRRTQERLRTLQDTSEEQWNSRLADVASGRRSVLMNGVDDMKEYALIYVNRLDNLWRMVENYTTPSGGNLAGLKRRVFRNSTVMRERLERYENAIERVATAPADKLTKNLLSEVIREETRLVSAFREQSKLYDDAIAAIGVKAKPINVRDAKWSTEEVVTAADSVAPTTPAARASSATDEVRFPQEVRSYNDYSDESSHRFARAVQAAANDAGERVYHRSLGKAEYERIIEEGGPSARSITRTKRADGSEGYNITLTASELRKMEQVARKIAGSKNLANPGTWRELARGLANDVEGIDRGSWGARFTDPGKMIEPMAESAAEVVGEAAYRVRLPKAFYDDHMNRDLPGGRVVKTTKRHYEVELSAEDYEELLDDARHYASNEMISGGFKEMGFGFASSARATVKALEKAKPLSREAVEASGRARPLAREAAEEAAAVVRPAPTTVRATRDVEVSTRQPLATPRSAAATDPMMAQHLFGAPADLYDELTRLRSMADELRLDLESALASKVTLPKELDVVAREMAERSSRLATELAGHRRFHAATKAERAAARRSEDAAFKTQRAMWQAELDAEAIEAGAARFGSRRHIGNVMQSARREFGLIGRPDPSDAMPAGRNTTMEEMYHARKYALDKRAQANEVFDYDAELNAPITYRELLGGIADMQALDLGDYLEGLMNGHLRRAFGLFIDRDGFDRYVDRLTGGGIIMGNVVDEENILEGLTGFEREAGFIREYHNALKAAGAGRVIRRDGLVEHLLARGVDGNRINRVMETMHKNITTSERFKSNIDTLRDQFINRYRATQADMNSRLANPNQALTVRGSSLYDDQEFLNDQVLGLLGDYAMGSMSLLESAGAAGRTLSRQRFFEETLKVAQDRGLVKGAPFVDRHGAVYRQVGEADNAIGGFGGKFVHPYLYKELQRAAQVKKDFLPASFTRVRALITGGYLASPAVLAANYTGGLYQGATAGIHPLTMMRRQLEVFPELRKASVGERSEFMEEVGRNLDINLTSLVGQIDTDSVARLIRNEAGVGLDGIRGFLDQAATKWENFLQRPFGMRFAGLEGFQFTEDWFKVATYKEVKERVLREGIKGPNGTRAIPSELRAQEIAAEAARTVVFDYSTLPTGLDFFKRTGLVLFPGFPFYIAGRTVAAALERPGTVAMADRIGEALMNASLTPEEQGMLLLSMPEWMQVDKGVPLPGTMFERQDGTRRMSVIPLAQLVPTVTVWDSFLGGGAGNPWGESLTQLGMWGPIIDIMSALTRGEGSDPTFTGRYGHTVFEAGDNTGEKIGHAMRFLYNTMAPSVVRRGLSMDYQGRAQGLLSSVYRAFAQGDSPPNDVLAGIYSVEERRTGRPDRGWREGIVSSFLRTPQVVALDGPLAGIRNEMQSERAALNEQLAALKRRRNRALAAGDNATSDELHARMAGITDAFNGRWSEYVNFYSDAQQRRKQQQELRP